MVTYYPEYFNHIFRVFFLRHTFLDNCSYLYLCFPKHSQYPSHFQLGSRNTTSFYLFVCFLFCLMWLLWANFLISAAVCVQMTSEIKQFNCINEETEKHQKYMEKPTHFTVSMT